MGGVVGPIPPSPTTSSLTTHDSIPYDGVIGNMPGDSSESSDILALRPEESKGQNN